MEHEQTLMSQEEAALSTPHRPTESHNAEATVETTVRARADTGSPQRTAPAATAIPQHHIRSLCQDYAIYGVDAIWHNQYCGPNSDFTSFRKAYDGEINALVGLVLAHVRQGLYAIISLTATPHMLVVVVACQKKWAEFPEGAWDEPAPIPNLFQPIED